MNDTGFAPLPDPPYWAVIFSSRRSAVDDDGYGRTAERMAELAREQPGYLGMESTRGVDGFGITIAYWRTPEDIVAWRRHAEHAAARELGRDRWYQHYEIRVARVERAYGWDAAT